MLQIRNTELTLKSTAFEWLQIPWKCIKHKPASMNSANIEEKKEKP
jgi:hypothetical protein